ncbi:hypothetical protein BOTBODRAFT_176659 [Botryobasidium botryosum FD-172 SS1]|uniref:Ricin B lectin domain-containing protein n=1 Tax=Botryobasidium botryosum (strain FD-172 SS1) TaxID=930990 RepID=A0A067MBR2_BOTB1|nr:hypothetical protein BOTBODRAFT_176659 [Botryobasidium botryosum FD-172 SS1]
MSLSVGVYQIKHVPNALISVGNVFATAVEVGQPIRAFTNEHRDARQIWHVIPDQSGRVTIQSVVLRGSSTTGFSYHQVGGRQPVFLDRPQEFVLTQVAQHEYTICIPGHPANGADICVGIQPGGDSKLILDIIHPNTPPHRRPLWQFQRLDRS